MDVNKEKEDVENALMVFIEKRDLLYEALGLDVDGVWNRRERFRLVPEIAKLKDIPQSAMRFATTNSLLFMNFNIINDAVEVVNKRNKAVELIYEWFSKYKFKKYMKMYNITYDDVLSVFDSKIFLILDKIKKSTSMLTYIDLWIRSQIDKEVRGKSEDSDICVTKRINSNNNKENEDFDEIQNISLELLNTEDVLIEKEETDIKNKLKLYKTDRNVNLRMKIFESITEDRSYHHHLYSS